MKQELGIMDIKVGNIVKGRVCGVFKVKALRRAAGYEGADLIPLNPETLQPGRHPSMWLQLENIVPMELEPVAVRHTSGLVWMGA